MTKYLNCIISVLNITIIAKLSYGTNYFIGNELKEFAMEMILVNTLAVIFLLFRWK